MKFLKFFEGVQGSSIVVSLNYRLQSNKEEKKKEFPPCTLAVELTQPSSSLLLSSLEFSDTTIYES